MALDALQHLIGAHPLPRVEHLVEQRVPVGEMPVEATLGHAERLRQGLDPDGVRAAGRKGPQAFLDPPATGRPGDGGHGLSLSVRKFDGTAGGATFHIYGTVYMEVPACGSRTPRTPPGPGASTSSRGTSGSRTCGRCRRPAARTTS